MGAGTEGFIDTRRGVNPIGSILSKVLEARKMAEEERQYASDIAENNETSLEEAGIERGYFFKKALQYKFGGEFADKKKHQLKTFLEKKNTAKAIMLGRSGRRKYDRSERIDMIWSLFEQGSKAPNFRDKFKELYKVSVKPQTPIVPGTTKRVQKATSSGNKRISKEELLQTLTKLLSSLEATAQALNGNVAASSAGIIKAANAQDSIADQLKHRGTTLEDKLDELIKAISAQTEIKKKEKQIQKASTSEKNLENIKDSASSEAFDNLMTPQNESVAATSSQRIEEQQQLAYQQPNIPQAETGGIISGPDSGYNVRLHGREMIVPLDNAFTNPNKPAVTERGRKLEKSGAAPKVSMMPKKSFEVGTPTQPPSMGGKLGFNITNKLAVGGTTQASAMSQSLMDAMSLPMVATGGRILATTTEYMKRVGDTGLSPDISRIARPIANVFGLPSSIVQKATAGKSTEKSVEDGGEDGMGSKNILAKLTEGFGKLLESMGKQIEENNPPGTTGPGIDFKGNAKSVEIPVSSDVMGAFENTTNWSIYRETIAAKESGGRYDPTPGRGGGAGGNYEGRYQINHEYLDDIAKLLGESAPTREQFRADPKMQERFMQAYTMDNKRILEAYSPKFKKMSKKEQMAVLGYAHSQGAGAAAEWVESGMGAGTADQFGTKGRTYYENIGANLEKYNGSSPPGMPGPNNNVKDLGQEITQNFGMQVGEERTFQHPKYGEIKAHKTAKGFKFYGPGINNVLNMNSNTPQAKSIVDYFINSNGGRTRVDDTAQAMAPPRRTTPDSYKEESQSGTGAQVAMLNIGGGSSAPTAGTSPQPTANNSKASVPQGRSPLDGLYTNPQEILTG